MACMTQYKKTYKRRPTRSVARGTRRKRRK